MTFKIILLGDGGVGKTCLLRKLINHNRSDSFEPRYLPTIGVNVLTFQIRTNVGDCDFEVWDTAGQEKLGGLRKGYYQEADAAIVMYDTQSRISYLNVQNWINDYSDVRPNSPIVICGNKCDITPQKIDQHPGIVISVKDSVNIIEPFLSVVQTLTNDNAISFIGFGGFGG